MVVFSPVVDTALAVEPCPGALAQSRGVRHAGPPRRMVWPAENLPGMLQAQQAFLLSDNGMGGQRRPFDVSFFPIQGQHRSMIWA